MAQEHRGSESGRVGVLWSQTGVTAVIEESQLKGTLDSRSRRSMTPEASTAAS